MTCCADCTRRTATPTSVSSRRSRNTIRAKGFNITFTIEEGSRYKVAAIDIVSNVAAVNAAALRPKLKLGPGDIYNADAVEKSVEHITIEIARRGYPFALVRPRGDRDFNRTRSVSCWWSKKARAPTSKGSTFAATRAHAIYVIRREFDLVEGDAYNRALVDRAEKRLKNLNFFKTVKVTTEPGSAPDRIIINVDVEEQSTGEFSFSGGYSTSDGMLGEDQRRRACRRTLNNRRRTRIRRWIAPPHRR